jgi:hypothetical protein
MNSDSRYKTKYEDRSVDLNRDHAQDQAENKFRFSKPTEAGAQKITGSEVMDVQGTCLLIGVS